MQFLICPYYIIKHHVLGVHFCGENVRYIVRDIVQIMRAQFLAHYLRISSRIICTYFRIDDFWTCAYAKIMGERHVFEMSIAGGHVWRAHFHHRGWCDLHHYWPGAGYWAYHLLQLKQRFKTCWAAMHKAQGGVGKSTSFKRCEMH